MSNCNILPMIIIAIVVILALYLLSKNDIVAPNTQAAQEGFYNYHTGYGYPYRFVRRYTWPRLNYPASHYSHGYGHRVLY